MMKKVLSVLTSIVMLVLLCVPAFAADTVQADVKTTLADGVVTVTLSVPAGSDLGTFESTLVYDAEKLELSDIVYGAGDMTSENKDTLGQIRLLMVWAGSQTDAATLVTVTFKAKDGATGKAAFAFKDTSATDSNDEAVEFGFGDNVSFEVALTEAPPTDEKIPSTAGKYVAVGSAAAAVVAAAVAAGAVIKRKKQEA